MAATCTPAPVAPEPPMCGSATPARPPADAEDPAVEDVRIGGRRSTIATSVGAVA